MTDLGDTKDTPRYKALGNSMAVPVMKWIGERIELVEKQYKHVYTEDVPIKSEVELSNEAIEYYEKIGRERYGNNLEHIEIRDTNDKDFLEIAFFPKEKIPFQRIRRITGYLVGSLETWNDAKRAEEADRVKHGLDK